MELSLSDSIKKRIEKALEKAGFAAPTLAATAAPEMNDGGRTHAPMGKSSITKSSAAQQPEYLPDDPVTAFKREAVALAREAAAERAAQNNYAPGSPESRPTLEDYIQTCNKLVAERNLDPKTWNPKIFAVIRAQNGQRPMDLSGFFLSEPKNITQPNAVQQQPDPNAPHHSVMENEMDLDGDHAISDFYTNIDFTGANLKNCYVDPATSFNDEIAKAATLEGITFNNMEVGEEFKFYSRGGTADTAYRDIHLTNINGGTITFESGTRVEGITIDGKGANIALKSGAYVEKISVNEDTRFLVLEAEGATIANSDLSNATIAMNSKLKGATLQGLTLNGNLCDVDLSDAKISNLKIDGKYITSAEELKSYGAITNDKTEVNAQSELVAQAQKDKALRDAQKVDFNKIILDTKTPEEKAALLASAPKEPKKDAPKQEKPKAPDNAAGLAKDDVGTNKSYYEAMNANIAAAPKEAPKQPFDLAAELGATIAASFKTPAQSAPIEKDPSQNAAKTKTDSFDRSYFARMSETNGRSIT